MSRNDEQAPRPLGHSARRINALAKALNARRYLEIGVANGSTFFSIDMPEKVAVDPKFRFDHRQHQTGSVRFFETPSDEFFRSFGPEPAFDIIFLDGLHVFAQTFRDFCATFALAHPRTVWVIDDTVPRDIYSAWPDFQEAVRQRRAAGGKSGAWHGDVFKVVFAIRDFFPTMNFCTVTEANPQTLVWFETRRDFKPLFDSLETIPRMSYFDFNRHETELNYCSEGEGIAATLEALGGKN
jgi:hypothetical protein